MPSRAPRRCTRPGCDGPAGCGRHDRPRPTRQQLGYDTDWLAISAAYLKQHTWCAVWRCRRRPEHVDHIDGDVANREPGNLQALCKRHHSQKTVLHDGGFGRPRTPRPGGQRQ